MINVRFRSAKPPLGRLGVEGTPHVLMDKPLQINAEKAIGPNHFIGADTAVWRDVPVGVGDLHIGGVIDDLVGGALLGGSRQPQAKGN